MTTIVGIIMFASMTLPTGAFFPIIPIIPVLTLSTPLYVDGTNGWDTDTGELADPVRTITKAIAIAKAGAGISYAIYVAEGDYHGETFPLDLSTKGISIYGGYYNHFADRDIANHQTAIKAGAANSIEIKDISSNISGLKIYDQSGGGGSVINADVQDGHSSYISISEVEIDNCSTMGAGISVNTDSADTVKIYNNFIHNMNSIGGGIFVSGDSSKSEINHNFLYNNVGLYNIGAEDSIISNNIITKASGNGIYMKNNSKAYNNTIVNGGTGIRVAAGVSGVEFKNNIIANNNDATTLSSSASHDYNIYHSNGTLGLTMASHEHDYDPMFADINSLSETNYGLGATSSCIDAGTEIADVTDDYFGTDRKKDGNADATYATDPGAIEYNGDVAASPKLQNVTASPNTFSPNNDGANDTTTISYDLNLTSNIKVEIYDGATLVDSLLSEVQGTGTHTTVWDGKNSANNVVAEKTYQFKVSADNSEGSVSQTGNVTVSLNATPPPSPSTGCAGFHDVAVSDSLCPAIQYVKNKGIFAGYPDGTFRPNDVINRAETTKVVLLGFGISLLPDDSTNLGFSDVIKNSWYMTYLRTGKHEGIVVGYKNGTFKPNQQVNKVEMLKIFLETSTVNLSGVVSTSYPYHDTPNDVWYSKYVQFSKDHALVDANADGNFYPNEGMKRGNVAELFYRFHQAGL